jgi:hypothetical protein
MFTDKLEKGKALKKILVKTRKAEVLNFCL